MYSADDSRPHTPNKEKKTGRDLDEKPMLPGDDIYERVDRGIRLWDKVMLGLLATLNPG
jgi:hypothetical protein